MRSNLRLGLGGAVAAALLVAASGCGGGGDGGGRPSAAEISSALRSPEAEGVLGDLGGKLDKVAADCLGKKFHDSKISDKALRALVRNDKDYEGSRSDQDAASKLLPEIGECVGAK